MTRPTLALLAAPVAADGLDCALDYRCLQGEACKPPETLRVVVRPEGASHAFQLVEGPGFAARREAIGAVTRYTTEPAFGLFWTLTVGAGGAAAATVTGGAEPGPTSGPEALAAPLGVPEDLVTLHFVGRCDAA